MRHFTTLRTGPIEETATQARAIVQGVLSPRLFVFHEETGISHFTRYSRVT